VARYRRASGVERQQLKWFALAAVLGGAFLVGRLLSLDWLLDNTLSTFLDSATTIGLYLTVGVAILRYRLYDIDVLINRTLVYGTLTAMLALIYVGAWR
jgi:membrane protein DedA with SNARE-associated domain